MPSFEGNLFTQWHQITSLETRVSGLSYGEDPDSLISPGLESVPGRDRQADRQTDRIPIANTHSQQYLLVQLSRIKSGGKLSINYCDFFEYLYFVLVIFHIAVVLHIRCMSAVC